MAEIPWTQQGIDRFFKDRKSPSQTQCDETARTISGASVVRPVENPGSLSYTVVCIGREKQQQSLILSFRELESGLDSNMVKLATEIHDCLVPEATNHGIMIGADPSLVIYSMPYLPGISCLDALSCQVEMDSQDEARHVCYMKHLARYFARCWSKPQSISTQVLEERQTKIHRKLANLRHSSSSVLSSTTISDLEHSLSLLFSEEYPQVLTHGDLSLTNILIDENTYEITGIVDWSLAHVLPFSMELDFLFLTMGYMDFSGWHDYECRPQLYVAFWEEFWTAARIEDGVRQEKVRDMAMSAARIGAVLHYSFQRNPSGSPSEVVQESNIGSKYLKAWFTD